MYVARSPCLSKNHDTLAEQATASYTPATIKRQEVTEWRDIPLPEFNRDIININTHYIHNPLVMNQMYCVSMVTHIFQHPQVNTYAHVAIEHSQSLPII